MRRLLTIGALLALLVLALPYLASSGNGRAPAVPPSEVEPKHEQSPLDLATPPAVVLASSGADDPSPAQVRGEVDVATVEKPPPVTAELFLRVVDRRTGQAVPSGAELWQLDLPEDEEFLAGDRRHGETRIGDAGEWLSEVPVGTYRAFVLGRSAATEDPPAFEVVAPRTRVDLVIDLPRLVRFSLDLRDHDGLPVDQARESRGFSALNRGRAPFAKERLRQDGNSTFIGFGGGGGGSYHGHTTRRKERGFDMGMYAERTAGFGTRRRINLKYGGHETVTFWPKGYQDVTGTLDPDAPVDERVVVGATLPHDFFDKAILLPHGGYAKDAGLRIDIECEPLPVEPGSPPDLWREVELTIKARVEGYKTLEFKRRAGDRRPIVRVMELFEPESS